MNRQGAIFVIDNPHRELRGARSVVERLRRRGIPAQVVSKLNYPDAFVAYAPRLVVLPRVTDDMARFARKAAASAIVTVVPSEHGSGFRDKVLAQAAALRPWGKQTADAAPDVVARCYVGGPNHLQWLAEAGIYRSDQLVLTGTLNSDHWMAAAAAGRRPGRRVGVASAFKSLPMSIDFDSLPVLLDMHRDPGLTNAWWRIGQSAFEMAHLMVLLEAIGLVRELDCEVSIRPHPHEHIRNWSRFVAHAGPGLILDRSVRLDAWLDGIACSISSFSTMAIDSIARGVPTISLERLVPEAYIRLLPDYKAPMPGPFSWQPESYDELRRMLRQALAGELQPSPDLAQAQAFMRDNFNIPRDRFAADLIADDLAALHGATEAHPAPAWARRAVAAAKMPLRDLRAYATSPRSENLYYWFSYRLDRDARQFAAGLEQAPGLSATRPL